MAWLEDVLVLMIFLPDGWIRGKTGVSSYGKRVMYVDQLGKLSGLLLESIPGD